MNVQEAIEKSKKLVKPFDLERANQICDDIKDLEGYLSSLSMRLNSRMEMPSVSLKLGVPAYLFFGQTADRRRLMFEAGDILKPAIAVRWEYREMIADYLSKFIEWYVKDCQERLTIERYEDDEGY